MLSLPCTTDRSNKLNAVAHTRARKRQGTRGRRIVGGKVEGRRGIIENNEPDFIYIVHFIQELTTTLF